MGRALDSWVMAFHRIGAHKQNNFATETLNPLGSPIDHGMKGTKLNLLPSVKLLKSRYRHKGHNFLRFGLGRSAGKELGILVG